MRTDAAWGRQGCWSQRSIRTSQRVGYLAFGPWSFSLCVLLSTSYLEFKVLEEPHLWITERTGGTQLTMAVALDAVWVRVKNVLKQNGLLILSVLAVVIGCLLGFFLRTRRLSEQVSLSPPLDPQWRHPETSCPLHSIILLTYVYMHSTVLLWVSASRLPFSSPLTDAALCWGEVQPKINHTCW